MPTIESRIVMDIAYDMRTREHVGIAYDSKTGDKLVEVRQYSYGWIRQNIHDAVSSLLREWQTTCDRTLTLEQKSRKTIISSCGQLKVSESHYLTVT